MTRFASRVIRTLVAASTLHLMLAVPVRACPADGAAAQASHAGMDASDASMAQMAHHQHGAAEQAPAKRTSHDDGAPCDHRMPCCPPASTGCAGAACLLTAPAAMTTSVSLQWQSDAVLRPRGQVWHGVSYLHAPEPPPPRI